jgi:hypothetical protein
VGYVRLNDDAIWASRIEGDDVLRAQILTLAAGESIELEVDGNVGTWVRMRDGRDGRPTFGLRPVGPMRDIWKSMQARRGEVLKVRRAVRGGDLNYLRMIQQSLAEEWDSPEDDEAYRDLPLR